MDPIPNGFLKLPELKYIGESPDTPYKFPMAGMIHSSKFQEIYDQIISNELPDIDIILQGHSLHYELSKLISKELADFCRHVIVINRDFIGWQESDELLVMIDRQFLATWQIPEFIFGDDFSNTLSTIIRWEPKDKVALTLSIIAKERKIPYLQPQDILDKLESNYPFWTIMDLWLLYDWLIDQVINTNHARDPESDYMFLLNELTDIFLLQCKRKAHELPKRIIIVSLFTRSYSKLSDKTLFANQDLIDRLWQEIEHSFSHDRVMSYRYLYAVNYANVGIQYYQHNIDFVTKRKLVNKILTSFLKFENMDIVEWLNYFVDIDLDPYLKEYIVNGFSTIAELLRLQALELPKSTLREEILEINKNILNTIFKVSKDHFCKRIKSDDLFIENVEDIQSLLNEKSQISKVHQNMAVTLKRSYGQLLYHNVEISHHYIDVFKDIITKHIGENQGEMYAHHLKMISGTYPFEDIYNAILNEIQDDGSIITSLAFEREVIKVISNQMDYLITYYRNTGKIRFKELEELFFFASQWLQYFADDKDLYQDVIMILSPILSINLVQLIQGYYERQMIHKAFLTYLIMQHFNAYIRSRMELVGEDKKNRNRSFLIQDYLEMISEWQNSEILDINKIKSRVNSIELSFTSQMDAVSGIIEDDIIMGYLDMTTNLEGFIQGIYVEEINIIELADFLYTDPSPGDMHIFNYIGFINSEIKPLKIPLIRNLNQYATALSLIPMDEKLIKLLQEDIQTSNFLDLLILPD